MTLFRSILFTIAFYLWNLVLAIGGLWTLLAGPQMILRLVRLYVHGVWWMEENILNIRLNLVGADQLPTDQPFIVAAKHQSTYETLKLHVMMRHPGVMVKRELIEIPLWGSYARRVGLIPIDRGSGSKALKAMLARATDTVAEGRPIVIFPQGTRVPPGRKAPYKIGVGKLYEALQLPVYPVALNTGQYWPIKKLIKPAGVVTIEVLPPITPGLDLKTFMTTLEETLETATVRVCDVRGDALAHVER